MHRTGKIIRINLVLFVALLVLLMADVLFGAEFIAPGQVWHALMGDVANSSVSAIVLTYRVPKAIVAVLVGVALSTSGLQMQTVFRNPLADPYILGVSSGAGLGVAIFFLAASTFGFVGLSGLFQYFGHALAAWIGAAAIMLVMLLIAARVRDIMAMLILGIMIGSAASALITVLQYFSDAVMLKSYMLWTMGSLGNVGTSQLLILTVVVVVGALLALMSSKTLNALMLGEEHAYSIGYNVVRHRALIIVSTTILTGTVTACCGPIGFVGVAVPHVARMILAEADHRYLMPSTMLLGATVMLFCDLLSQLPGTGVTLPINTITALIGIPVVIVVIIRNQKIV